VNEMCRGGLDLFYRNQKSDALGEAVRPERNFGTLAEVSQANDGLSGYLRIFLERWNKELAPSGELVWRIASPPSGAPLLAVLFETHYKSTVLPASLENGTGAWHDVLTRLEQSSKVPVNGSRIFIDTFFRAVSEREMLFIKRDERRFWTSTSAREDAESALTHLMSLEDVAQDGGR
jgi:hypothetical protein